MAAGIKWPAASRESEEYKEEITRQAEHKVGVADEGGRAPPAPPEPHRPVLRPAGEGPVRQDRQAADEP